MSVQQAKKSALGNPGTVGHQSMRTIDGMKAFAARTGAQLWVNHDMEQHAKIPKAPQWVQ
jgi:hypothetical protein